MGTICDGEIIAIQLTTDMKPGLPRKKDSSYNYFFPYFFFNDIIILGESLIHTKYVS